MISSVLIAASFAIPPSDAERFRLQDYSRHTVQFKRMQSEAAAAGTASTTTSDEESAEEAETDVAELDGGKQAVAGEDHDDDDDDDSRVEKLVIKADTGQSPSPLGRSFVL
jgi:hypothetical protein